MPVPDKNRRTPLPANTSGIDKLEGAKGVLVMVDQQTYKIVRFYRGNHNPQVIKRGLTLAEARAHCSRPDTKADNWFDGYQPEGEWTAQEIIERAG